MKRYAVMALITLCSGFSHAVDSAVPAGEQDDEVIEFSINGFHLALSRAFIKRSRSSYLIDVVRGEKKLTLDREGRLFIPLHQKEGKVLQDILCYGKVSKRRDRNIVKNAVEHFGFPKEIRKKVLGEISATPQTQISRSYKPKKALYWDLDKKSWHCNVCSKDIRDSYWAIEHGRKVHHAEVIRDGDLIFFR